MKKLLFLLISIPLIFSSCEKEEENPSNNNNNNSNTGTSGSIYGEWKVISDVSVESDGDVDSVIFLPNEYCHITFLDEPNADDSNYDWFIVENGYYDNSMVWTIDIDSNGTYLKTNNDLIIDTECGSPIGLEDTNYIITLLTSNKLEFFVSSVNSQGTWTWSFKLERP
tara:strand:- start:101 stop:604 length:504 start_codon:yes stop_codon:yes gene_type:complete